MRISLDNRLFKGTAVFEENGDRASLFYKSSIKPPVNSRYEINGSTWKVVNITDSDYVKDVINIELEKI